MDKNTDADLSARLRQIGGATLVGTIGVCFAYTSIYLFVSNQRNYVRNFKKFLNTKYKCRIVSQPSPTNENKLIYISDNIKPNDNINDNKFEFDINVPNNDIIYLYRECEMYQWQEIKSNTETKYSKIWSSLHIDCSDFKDIKSHQNPLNMIQSKLFYTKDFTVSNFSFHLNDNQSITSPKIPIQLLLKHGKLLKGVNIKYNGNKSIIEKDHSKYGWYYFSNNDNNNIGDIRVRFWMIRSPLSLTVIGKQINNKININNEIQMRFIGKYKLNNALKKFFHVRLINSETGSIFVMTNISLMCCIYATELLKPIILNDKMNNNKEKPKTNDIGLRALIGSVSICGPIYFTSVMYPYIQMLHNNYPTLVNSIGVLTVATFIFGGAERLVQN